MSATHELERSGFGGAGATATRRARFESVLRETWDSVLSFLWKRVPTDEAQDLAQSVYLAAYRGVLAGAGPPLDDVGAWQRYLLASARNALVDRRRRDASRATPASFDEPFESAAEHATGAAAADFAPLESELREALRECIAGLGELQRALCCFHFVDGVGKRELARRLERPEATVRAWLVDATRALRRCLEHKGLAP